MSTREEEVRDSIMEFEDTDKDVEMLDDGSSIVTLPEGGDVSQGTEGEFYDNLAESIPIHVRTALATVLKEAIDIDKETRSKRDKEYAESIRRTGLGKEAPGGAAFDGASKAVHPLLTESTVDYASRAIKELVPSDGPVRTYIPGTTSSPDRLEKADRKKDYMNWQFLTQMPEFRPEIEQLLPQMSLNGSQYLRLTPDTSLHRIRAVPKYVPQDQVYIPYAASSFYSAERQTYAEPITMSEFESRVMDEMYLDIEGVTTTQYPEQSEAQKASDSAEGKAITDYYNKDGVRIVYEISMFHAFDEDEQNGGRPVPYIISMDEPTGKIVSVVRNWEEDDPDFERMQWMVEFAFVPWRGAYSIGLGQMIGSLSGAATGALRALLDAAHVNNIPTAVRLKGANFSGQTKSLNAAEITEISGGVGSDDIRKLLMHLPFNSPSPVLYQLLGFCVDAGKGVVRTTMEHMAEGKSNMPVGTTLAMLEDGMHVMGAIHLRSYHSMTKVIEILHRINKMYMTDEQVSEEVGEVIAYREDFQGPMDVIPTADPQIFSDVQRIAQLQIVSERADAHPELYNRRLVEKRLLDRTKIPNPEELLIPEQKVEPMNQVNENIAMTLGRPVSAFPDQDHLAHMQVLLDYVLDPTFGQLPIIAPTFLPAAMQHLKEHLVLWYAQTNFELLKEATDLDDEGLQKIMADQDKEAKKEMDRTLASGSSLVLSRSATLFGSVPVIVQNVQQMLESFKPDMPDLPVDPNAQAETQRKAQESSEKMAAQAQSDRQDMELEFAKLSVKERADALSAAQEEALAASARASRLHELMLQERARDERTIAELGSAERRNTQDNLTALQIAAAEIASGDKTSLSTGTGINP